jgi:tetratricopeptide (TPR) repeat protein
VKNVYFRELVEKAERLFAVNNRSEEALTTVQRALRLRPTDARAKIVKARVLFSLGRFPAASRTLNQVIRQHPRNSEAHLERARILYALRGRHRQALRELRSALSYAHREKWLRFEILRLKGRIYVQLDRDHEAIRAFRAALKIRPGDALLLADIGKAILLSGRPAPAIRYLQRALLKLDRLNSSDERNREWILVAKAEALMALGRYWGVIRLVREEIRSVHDPIARRLLGKFNSRARQLSATVRHEPPAAENVLRRGHVAPPLPHASRRARRRR